uniref:Ubiquitin-like-conjugating enzyme ATG10 n=1 Tax=Callorhinchus milii TaxID=7868 RepID=V9KXB4_CALMI
MSNNFSQSEDICLGEKQFLQFCDLFIKHSEEINDGWQWRKQGPNEGYMVKVHLTSRKTKNNFFEDSQCLPSLPGLESEACSEGEAENIGIDKEEAPVTTLELIQYEYHVVYSCSYQVPVLYFKACFSDGRPLTLEEIWENVHDCYKERLLQGPWETITQQEHHLLGQPFFILHPCRTSELMTPIMAGARQEKRDVNYITSWLSMVGPVVGLDLPTSYATAMSQCI